jgi:hypothetical protein
MKYINGELQLAIQDDFDALQSYWDNINSAGRLWGGEITDNLDGTVTVAAGGGLIKADDAGPEDSPTALNEGQGSILSYIEWTEVTDLALTDDAYNFVYYDGGDSTIKATTNFYSISFTDSFTLGRCYLRDGTTAVVRLCGTNIWNFNRRVQLFGEEVFPVIRATGLALAETGTRNIAITEGILWTELVNRFSIDAFDSSGTDVFTYWYRDTPSGWVEVVDSTQIDNEHWDDGSGTLDDLTLNRYGVHWVYVVHDGSVHVIYGQGNYTLASAEIATPPASIPGLLSSYGSLIGRILIKKDEPTFYAIESAFTQIFSPSAVTDHNDLVGLQGGVADEYYHLSATKEGYIDQNVTSGASPTFDTKNMNFYKATPVNAEVETAALTFTYIALHGELVEIGGEVYELLADDAQVLSEGSDYAVDITAYTDKSEGTLTIGAVPTANNTMTISSKVYTFVESAESDGDIEIDDGDTPLLSTHANIVSAILGTDGINTTNPDVTVTAFAGNDLVVTARVGGTAGNSIDTLETFTSESNFFDANTLGTTTGGTDCASTDAVLALETSINANSTVDVTASDNGAILDLVKDMGGDYDTTTTTTCANATFGDTVMVGGVDGTLASAGGIHLFDDNYLYVATDVNTRAGTNWKKVELLNL